MAAKAFPLETYTQALLWTCTSCGAIKEGRQPHLECPSCQAHKTCYINLPQHLEVEIRNALGKGELPNGIAARQKRLALMREHDVLNSFYVKGRFLP